MLIFVDEYVSVAISTNLFRYYVVIKTDIDIWSLLIRYVLLGPLYNSC